MSFRNYTDGHDAIDYQKIKLLNPLAAYCEKQGIEVKRSSNRWIGKCPLHNEQNGEAFVIHPDEKWQCYGQCARQGDVIDLEMLLHGGTNAEAARRLGGNAPIGGIPPVSRTQIGVLEIPKHVSTKENPLALPYVLSDEEKQDCHRFTLRLLEDRQYMERCSKHRQWKLETIRNLALDGYMGRDDDGHICFNSAAGCKSRWRQDGERRFKFLFGKSWLWRGELIPEAGTVYITEGETDAITLIDFGMEEDGQTVIVAMQGATFNIEPWSFLFNDKDVIISTDYDDAGRKAADKIEIALSDVARSISFLQLSECEEVVRA